MFLTRLQIAIAFSTLLVLIGSVLANTQLQTTLFSPEQYLQASKKYGPLAAKRFKAWQALVDNNLQKSERIKLEKVNDFFNQVLWVSDQQHWGTSDYWATPIEMLGTDAGDCEDYTIAKYFTLKALGVPEKKLYLTYVKAIRLNQAHMVLTYFDKPNTIPLVLDNINKRILPANKRRDLVPIYSFNGDGLWLAKERGKGKAVSGGSTRLKKWNSLLKKMDVN